MAEDKLTMQGTVNYGLRMGVIFVVVLFCFDVVTGEHSDTYNSFHLRPAIRVFFVGFISGVVGNVVAAILKEER